MGTTMKLNKKQIAPLLRALGITYTGRTFTMVQQAQYHVDNGATQWGGGSKTEVHYLRTVAKGQVECVDMWEALGNPVAVGPKSCTFVIPPGAMVVERSWFCGKDCGVRVIVGTAQGQALPPCLPQLPAGGGQ